MLLLHHGFGVDLQELRPPAPPVAVGLGIVLPGHGSSRPAVFRDLGLREDCKAPRGTIQESGAGCGDPCGRGAGVAVGDYPGGPVSSRRTGAVEQDSCSPFTVCIRVADPGDAPGSGDAYSNPRGRRQSLSPFQGQGGGRKYGGTSPTGQIGPKAVKTVGNPGSSPGPRL